MQLATRRSTAGCIRARGREGDCVARPRATAAARGLQNRVTSLLDVTALRRLPRRSLTLRAEASDGRGGGRQTATSRLDTSRLALSAFSQIYPHLFPSALRAPISAHRYSFVHPLHPLPWRWRRGPSCFQYPSPPPPANHRAAPPHTGCFKL